MKRFYISLALLAVMICVCVYSFRLFDATREEMSARLDSIESAAMQEESHAAVSQLCKEYSEIWLEKEKHLMRFIRHPQLDEISSITAELRYLASDDSYSHLLAAIDRIRANMVKIGGAEAFWG